MSNALSPCKLDPSQYPNCDVILTRRGPIMLKDSFRYLFPAVMTTMLLITAGIMLDDRDTRTHPDRDDTRLERVIDVQLPTL